MPSAHIVILTILFAMPAVAQEINKSIVVPRFVLLLLQRIAASYTRFTLPVVESHLLAPHGN